MPRESKLGTVRRLRGVPAKRGMRVNGNWGVIAGTNSSANLNVRFDSQRGWQLCHPRWRVKYYGEARDYILGTTKEK